jgi:hypothetical protein
MSTCSRDALHCIYARLTLPDALPAMRACRAWYAAATHEPSRKLECTSTHALLASVRSKLGRGRHVVALDVYRFYVDELYAWEACADAVHHACTRVRIGCGQHVFSVRRIAHLALGWIRPRDAVTAVCGLLEAGTNVCTLSLEPRGSDSEMWHTLAPFVARMPRLRTLRVATSCAVTLSDLCVALPATCDTFECVVSGSFNLPFVFGALSRLPPWVTRVVAELVPDDESVTACLAMKRVETTSLTIPDTVRSVQWTGLAATSITSRFPAHLTTLHFVCTSPDFTAAFVASLERFTCLERLVLENANLLEGDNVAQLAHLSTTLRHLELVGCWLYIEQNDAIRTLAKSFTRVRLHACRFFSYMYPANDDKDVRDVERAIAALHPSIECTGDIRIVHIGDID